MKIWMDGYMDDWKIRPPISPLSSLIISPFPSVRLPLSTTSTSQDRDDDNEDDDEHEDEHDDDEHNEDTDDNDDDAFSMQIAE